jgi:DNA-binding transcriptional MocR family regulator
MDHLYHQIANRLATSIEQGVLAPGDKLPGVRVTSTNEGVSPATVVAAYRHLEDDGYVEARPRSGYYVRPRIRSSLEEPATSQPDNRPSPVTGQQLVLQLVRSISDPHTVTLGANVPDPSFLPTTAIGKSIVKVGHQYRHQVVGYQVPPGLPELRVQVARRMLQIGSVTSPDDVLITAGCQEAIYLSLKSVTSPGDVVAIESPTYYGLLQAIESLGLKALEIPTHPRDGISVDALKLALEKWPVKACALVANFSNPLGAMMPDDSKLALVELMNSHPGVTVIEDDIYGDLNFEGNRPSTLKSLDRMDNVIYCTSLSKSIGAGLRIGWVVSRRHHERLCYEKFVANCATSTLGQYTALALFENGSFDRHLRGMRLALAQSASRMIERVGEHFPTGTRITQPRGGMTLWVELPDNRDATALAQQALAQGISVAPGQIFSCLPDKFRHFLRLNCAVAWSDRMERAVKDLGDMAKEIGPVPENSDS